MNAREIVDDLKAGKQVVIAASCAFEFMQDQYGRCVMRIRQQRLCTRSGVAVDTNRSENERTTI